MAPMTRRQRLEATIAGEPADRVPVALWRHFPGDDQDPAELARAHLDFQRLYDFDFIKITPSYTYCVADWGVRDRYLGNDEGVIEVTQRAVKEKGDWRRLRPLDPNEGELARQLRCIELIRDAVGQDVPFIPTVFNPLGQLIFLAGELRELPYLRRDPQLMKGVLEVVTETTVCFVEQAMRRGAAGIFMSTIHASYTLMSEREYLEFGRPYDLRVLEAAQDGWLNVLHLHGEEVMFDLLADYPVAAVNWHDRATPPALNEAYRRFPRALIGGLSQWDTLLRGTPEDVRNEVTDAVRQTNGERLIVGAGCVTPITSPTCNIRAARLAVEA